MKNYVYVYLDPRIKIDKKFSYWKFEYEPFYVGMGSNQRLISHLFEAKKTIGKCNSRKINRIRGILKTSSPIVIKIKERLTRDQASLLEQRLIIAIGRKDLKNGPLLNLTDGGEGNIGPRLSVRGEKNWLNKLSKEDREYWIKNHCVGENNPNFGNSMPIKSRLAIAQSNKKRVWNKSTLIKMSKLTGDKNPNFRHGLRTKKNTIEKSKLFQKEEYRKKVMGRVGEKNNHAKLTIKQVKKIRLIYPKLNLTQLGLKFNVTKQSISAIVKNQTWIHI